MSDPNEFAARVRRMGLISNVVVVVGLSVAVLAATRSVVVDQSATPALKVLLLVAAAAYILQTLL